MSYTIKTEDRKNGKTLHQKFIEELRNNLIRQDKKPAHTSNPGNDFFAENQQYDDDLRKEVEEKFKELFGDADDNDDDDDWEA